jgi:hypothetical protein
MRRMLPLGAVGARTIALAMITSPVAHAAVGCTLNDSDRDIMRVFPDATSYKTEFIAISERGGDSLAARIEAELGDALDPVFEALDVPYAYYTVLKGQEVIGRMHGVNQRGTFGGMQLILATDPDGVIVDFYYQKLSSPEAKRFRANEFTEQFRGLALADFLRRNEMDGPGAGPSPIAAIEDPSRESGEDFVATLRGLTKNLILLREFVLKTERPGAADPREPQEEEGNAHD